MPGLKFATLPGILSSMSQDNLLRLKSSSGTMLYSRKNKKKLAGHKLELKKYDKKLRKRVVFKETKK